MKWVMPHAESICIHLVGAGGTGSMIATRLAKLAVALRKLDDGAPPIEVEVFDPDTVSSANIGRQAFFEPDIGQNKAQVLVNRINLCEGLAWKATPNRWDGFQSNGGQYSDELLILITAVDTRAARQNVHQWFRNRRKALWLDCGNNETSGQVLLGARYNGVTQLPSVADLFPEVTEAQKDATDTAPSCSLAEALLRQDLMINPTIANTAVTLLWRAIRFGGLDYHGAFHDVTSLSASPIPIEPTFWKAMGWDHAKGARVKKRSKVSKATPTPAVAPVEQESAEEALA